MYDGITRHAAAQLGARASRAKNGQMVVCMCGDGGFPNNAHVDRHFSSLNIGTDWLPVKVSSLITACFKQALAAIYGDGAMAFHLTDGTELRDTNLPLPHLPAKRAWNYEYSRVRANQASEVDEAPPARARCRRRDGRCCCVCVCGGCGGLCWQRRIARPVPHARTPAAGMDRSSSAGQGFVAYLYICMCCLLREADHQHARRAVMK